MCGFFGVFGVQSCFRDDYRQDLLKILDHRGPDSSGLFQNGPIFLAHNRLSIIDLSVNAGQPFVSSECKDALVFNGEIYNYRELRDELRKNGYKFLTDSDTEVVFAGIRVFGSSFIQRLNGMFALAFWSDDSRKLMLARDRFGIKPLYVYNTGEGLLFASEIKAILELDPEKKYGFNTQAFLEYSVFGASIGRETHYLGIEKFPIATVQEFSFRNGRVRLDSSHIYWQPTLESRFRCPEAELVEVLVEKLSLAVRRQLVSDVPVGVLLSGGIDSSALTSFATEHYRGRMRSFSIAFEGKLAESELPMAKMVAQRCGTLHTEIVLPDSTILDSVQRLSIAHDLPFGDAANVPLMFVSNLVRGDVKVLLQGDGGDEIFGGYSRHRTSQYRNVLGFASLIIRLGSYFSSNRIPLRVARFSDIWNGPNSQIVAKLLTSEKIGDLDDVFRMSTLHDDWKTDSIKQFSFLDEFNQNVKLENLVYLADLKFTLPDFFLEKVDRATMASSLEVRVPFLDNDLVDFALAVPSRSKSSIFGSKLLLRKALEKRLPLDVLRARKRGFGVPYGDWLRGTLFDFAHSEINTAAGKYPLFINRTSAIEKLEQHRLGRYSNSFLLWKVFVFSIWINRYGRYFRF